MYENITEEELHEAIKADLPKLRMVKYEEMLMADKVVCLINRIDYGVRVWGEYRAEENTIFLLEGMPHEVQLDVVGFHEGRHFFGGADLDGGMHNMAAENKHFGHRTFLRCVLGFLVEIPLIPLVIIGELSKGIQMSVMKRKIYLEEENEK